MERPYSRRFWMRCIRSVFSLLVMQRLLSYLTAHSTKTPPQAAQVCRVSFRWKSRQCRITKIRSFLFTALNNKVLQLSKEKPVVLPQETHDTVCNDSRNFRGSKCA